MPLVWNLGRPVGVLVGQELPLVRKVALLLLVILVVLPPLSHVRLPDPLWITGIYDDADFDAVVEAIGSAIGLADESRLPGGKPYVLFVATLAMEAVVPTAVLRSTRSVRAPPA